MVNRYRKGILGSLLVLLVSCLGLAAGQAEPADRAESDLKLLREAYGIVACSTSDSYTRFDVTSLATDPSVSVLPEGDYPYDATMNPDGTEIWIPGASGDGVVVVDRATGTITQRILAGEYPVSVAFSQDGALALVGCRDSETIEVIDTSTYAVVSSLPVPTTYLGAGNIALDPASGFFYCVDWYGDDLYEIAPDGSAIMNQVIDLGVSLWQLVVSPDGQFIYITDRGTDEVRVVDRATLTQIGSFPVGDDPWGIDITENGEKLVVTCEDSHDAYIIEVGTGTTVPLLLEATADPRDVDILDSASQAFVVGGRVGTTSNPVFVLDLLTNTIATSFEANGTNTNVIAVQPQMHEVPVGVAVEPLQAMVVSDGVALSWRYDVRVADGFHIYRRVSGENPRRLTDVPLSNVDGNVRFFDSAPGYAAGTTLYYSHGLIRGGVEVSRSEEVAVTLTGGVPAVTVLHPVFPNPFNPLTNVRFELKHPGHVRLLIFDLAGRHVRTLIDASLQAAVHERQWDGRDAQGRVLPSGTYYVRLDTEHESAIQRMTLLK